MSPNTVATLFHGFWYPAFNTVQFRIPDKGEALCSTSDERILLKDLHILQHDQTQIIVDWYINTETGEIFNAFVLNRFYEYIQETFQNRL